MKKKLLSALLCVVMAMSLAVGCGASDSEKTEENEATTEEKEGEDVVITAYTQSAYPPFAYLDEDDVFQGLDPEVLREIDARLDGYTIAVSAEMLGLIAFSINLGAYTSETIRSAIEAVPNGQFEAAKSIGMTTRQMMLRIIIPQAIRSAVPNLTNVMINTMKDTSLLFTIGIIDMMGQAKIFGARTLKLIEVYVAVALIYWIICIVMVRVFSVIEKKSKVYSKAITQ